jgi:dUTP pyrophosphatase
MKIKKLHENAIIPKYQTSGAAGFDFHAVKDVIVMPGETEIVETGLAFQIPAGLELQVRPRSGMSAKTKIRVANSPGTIDCDYLGEVKIILDNIGHTPYHIKKGDRIAQGVFCEVWQYPFEEVNDFEVTTERGDKGFGSTGK